MTNAEALKLVTLLKAAWPRQELGADTLAVYRQFLGDLDFDVAQAAVQRLVVTSKFFPSVAEIRAEVASGETSHLPDPEVAWGEVRKAISRYGGYRTPVFDHPEIEAAVNVIGWQTICFGDNPISNRSRFVDAYRSIRERRVQHAQLGSYAPAGYQLPGKRTGEAKRLGALLSLPGGKADAK